MKKRLVILAFALGVALCGCGKKNEENSVSYEPLTSTEANAEEQNSASEDNDENKVEYEGVYVDDDGSMLGITKEGDSYKVNVDIVRLTSLSDGVGKVTEEGLAFTANDANDEPMGCLVTLNGDKATLTITNSVWPLLENGETFVFVKRK